MVKRGTGVAHAEIGRLPACRRLYMAYIVVLTPFQNLPTSKRVKALEQLYPSSVHSARESRCMQSNS